MCETCGCSDAGKVTLTNLATGKIVESGPAHHHEGHAHVHDHDHHREHDGHHHHDHEQHDRAVAVPLQQAVLAKNDALAARNRAWLSGREILALNLVSGPGAGKTTLLERTIRELS